MPKVKYKGETFVLRWTPEQDAIILDISNNHKGQRIDWSSLESHGDLKGLPDINISAIGARMYVLRSRAAGKKLKKPKKVFRQHTNIAYSKRVVVFNTFSKSKRDVWNDSQRAVLIKLVDKYKGEKIIFWKRLMLDSDVLKLPERYHFDKALLIRYHWSLVRKDMDEPSRTRANKKYKKKNRKKLVDKNAADVKARVSEVNEFLRKLLPMRK